MSRERKGTFVEEAGEVKGNGGVDERIGWGLGHFYDHKVWFISMDS